MESRPLADDPFHNLVFSISLTPPSRDVLLDWEKHIDKRLKSVLYDEDSEEHFRLFPDEVCVVYSHNNHFTSVTSDRWDLLRMVFEDIVERQLTPVIKPPLPPEFVEALYSHTKTFGTIRLNAERLYTDRNGQNFMLLTYPKKSTAKRKRFAKMWIDDDGKPVHIDAPQLIPRWKFVLKYSDLSFTPMALVVMLMLFAVASALAMQLMFSNKAPLV
jgi:hypothetical protein